MQITEIKVDDLVSFVGSEQYNMFDIKPITELRAISQYNNPDALADDVALIIAHQGESVLGFVGLLPRNKGNSNLHVYSNSCWWVHPEKGKVIAIPLFLMALKKCKGQMYLAECTSYTKSILEKTGSFQFSKPQLGVRGFVRFYSADIFAKKYKNIRIFKWILRVADWVLNILWQPVRYYFLSKYNHKKLEFEPVEKLDQELAEFIYVHSSNEFLHKSPAIFEWIKKYPWVKESTEQEPYEYPFTHFVKDYSLKYFALKKKGELKAFVAISNRDNLAKIPFLYFEEQNSLEVMHSIFWYILKMKCDSVVSFHPAVVEFMNRNRMPFIFRNKEQKVSGTTKSLRNIMPRDLILQDGDGDVVFT